MKVKNLIVLLSKVDPEREVIMSSDAEGNHYSPLYRFYEGSYVPENSYSGDVYCESYDNGTDPEDVRIPGQGNAVAAIILKPTN